MSTHEEDRELEYFTPEGEEELYAHHRIVADRGQEPLRIDKFLCNRLELVSRTRIQAAAEAGCILVNEKPVRSNYRIKPGDVITIVLPHKPERFDLKPEHIPLTILYEDDDLMVINKPPGLVVHPGVGNYTGTLVNGLLHHFNELPVPGDESFRPGLVHRIDKNTSGILVVAKREYAMNHLAKQFFDHTIERRYLALVWGEFDAPSGTITGNIARHQRFRKMFDVYPPDGEIGKSAITHYRTLEHFGYTSLVECQLETGRTHQIRVHMQHIGHPIFNDDTYGGDRIVQGTIYTKYKQFVENCFGLMPRQGLHARSLGFEHPRTGEHLYFETPLPPDMEAVVNKWRDYAKQLKIPE